MKFTFQKLFAGIIIIIVLAFVLLRGNQLVELVETVQRGSMIPLLFAVATQLGKYFAQSFAYSNSFAAVEERMRACDTLPLVFGTFFMNTIAPSLNTAGMALVVDDAHRRGIEPGKATSAAILMQMSIESGFASIMLVGFVLLAFIGNLNPLWFLLGLFVLLMIALMGCILYLGHSYPKKLMRLLKPIEAFVKRILIKLKKTPLKPWAEKTVVSFGEAAGLIAKNPKKVLRVYAFSLLASACELVCFCLVGVSFGVSMPQALITGYVIATLFAMISITPQGVGVVEAAVLVLFTSYGVTGAIGMAIAIVYRGLVFWMPFLIGAVLIQRTKAFRESRKSKSPDSFLSDQDLYDSIPLDIEEIPKKTSEEE